MGSSLENLVSRASSAFKMGGGEGGGGGGAGMTGIEKLQILYQDFKPLNFTNGIAFSKL